MGLRIAYTPSSGSIAASLPSRSVRVVSVLALGIHANGAQGKLWLRSRGLHFTETCARTLVLPQTLLADSDIVKVGVGPNEDASFLEKDYGLTVKSTLDLRFLAVTSGYQPRGLAKMAAEHFNITLDKRLHVICSDWEAPELSREQQDYAAKDALVAIELFRHFAAEIEPKAAAESAAGYVKRIIDAHCRNHLDQPFKESAKSTKSSADSTTTTDAKV